MLDARAGGVEPVSDDLVGRYRRVYVRIWDDPKFRNLSPTEQRLALYLLSGPQTNRIGLFKFSIPRAADDLNLGIETLRKAFWNVCTTFNWMFDADARVIYIPSWWRWNSSVNTNILLGNLKDLSEIPSCALVDAFSRNITYLSPKVHESFIEALRQRLPQSSPTSGSGALSGKQETGKQKTARRAEVPALRAVSPNPSEQHDGKDKGGSDEKLLMLARATVAVTSSRADLDELVESFHHVARDKGDRGAYKRTDIVAAVNEVLSEHRSATA